MLKVYSRYLIVAAVIFSFFAAADFFFHALPQKYLEVDFFDVGQGDAIFIETPSRHQILIDGGPGDVVLEKLGREMGFFDREIDLVVATHGDADHLAGLIEVLRRYEVGELVFNGYDKQSGLYREFLEAARERGVEPIAVDSGEVKHLPDGVEMLFLWPDKNLSESFVKKHNNTGVVARLNYGETSFLLTSDIEGKVEKILTDKNLNLETDVLKIAHHGSKTSTTEEFLRAVMPQAVVISVGGDNSYGHPHPNVLERLSDFALPILRTDLNGDIEARSDGKIIKFRTQKH